MREVRELMDKLYLPMVPLFASSTADLSAGASAGASFGSISMDLPVNVHLATLEAVGDRQLLVRLAHQFAVGEDPALSQPVSLDLFALLASYKPISADELTLSANQLKSEQLAGKIQWPTQESITTGAGTGAGVDAGSGADVEGIDN